MADGPEGTERPDGPSGPDWPEDQSGADWPDTPAGVVPYRSLVDGQGEGIGVVDTDEVFVFANPAADRIFGVPKGKLVGRSLHEFLDESEFAHVRGETGLRREGRESTYELVINRPSGERRTILVTATPRREPDGSVSGSYGVFFDITRRKREEKTLREGEERYRALVESLPQAVCLATRAGIEFANSAALRMRGLASMDDLAHEDLASCFHEGDASMTRDLLSRLMDGDPGDRLAFASRLAGPDGMPVPVEVDATSILFHGEKAIHVVLTDLTNRIREESEKRQLEDALRHAQKMESIGRLAGGIAHDFNNLLAPIILIADLALSEMGQGDPRRSDFEEVRSSALRAKKVIQQLLALGRKQVLSVKIVALDDVVHASFAMIRRLLRADLEIDLRLDPETGMVSADPVQLQQVILNLVLNAQDAMPGGGRLVVSTYSMDLRENRRDAPGVPPGEWSCLSVSDTGTGMDTRTLALAFEPFFTTKPRGRGTGLGLSMVQGIVEQHGGRVTVTSVPEHGSTFLVWLPRVHGAPERLTPLPPGEPGASMSGTVLLAEDDEFFRRMLRRMLEGFGLTVLEAADGEAALAIAGSHDGPIHVLLTDVVMPHLNGRRLREAVIGIRPGIRVIFMSGYTDDVLDPHEILDGAVPFLQKPFTMEALRETLVSQLGK